MLALLPLLLTVSPVAAGDLYGEAIPRGLPGTGVEPSATGAVVLVRDRLAPSARSAAQEATVSGRVIDAATRQPLSGASVRVAGTTRGTLSGANGQFVITGVPAGEQRVTATRLGYGEQAQTVTVTAGRTATMEFSLQPAAVELEGIVAVGYGTQQKRDVTGAVGSVRAEELEQIQVPSVAHALQGRVAGVQVTQSSSAPGGGVSIRIRGSGSLSTTNEPLYVIDGVPISGSDHNDPSSGRGRNGHVNPLAFLNPEDIQSIEVLKDASSTAIYGARGTNGVVLITTKKGQAGAARMEFESSIGTQQVARRMPLLNATEYAEYANEWARLEGLDRTPFANPASFGTGTDWQDLIFREAPVQEHQVSVLGGTDATRFAISLNYMDQQGVIRTSEFQRYSLRANVSHEVQSWLTLGTNLNVSRMNASVGFTDAAGARGAASAVNSALSMIPLLGVYNEQGQYTWMDRDWPAELAGLGTRGLNYENPLGIINEAQDAAEYDRVLGNVYAEMSLLEGLDLRLNGSANIVNNSRNEYFTSRSRRGGQGNNGLAEMGVIEQSHYLGEAIFNYRRGFGELHSLDVTAGATIEQEDHLAQGMVNRNFPNDITRFYNIGVGTPEGGPDIRSGFSDWTLLSYLGRVNYSLADKYLFTVTGRADGSSKFGDQNKWGFFPSAAFAWRVSQEPFLAGADWLSDLKLRASYGQTGNQEIGTYASLARLGDRQYHFGGPLLSGYVPVSIANPDLRWERSEQFDAGLDAAFLDGRFTLTFDVYRKLTDDLLLNVPLPYETGFGSALQNLGSVQNQGVELALGMDVLNGDRGPTWTTSLNLAANRNKVIEIGESGEIRGGGISGDMNVGGLLVREGLPMGVFYGFRSDGIFRDQAEVDAYVNAEGKPIMPKAVPGQLRLVDTNGDGRMTQDDRTVLGNPEADFNFGWTNDVTWGSFNLVAFVQGTYGNEVYNVNLEEIAGVDLGVQGGNLYAPRWHDRWTPENPDGRYPVLNLAPGQGYVGPGTNADLTDEYIEDGSYLRLRNLTLSYNVPSSASRRLAGMQNARLYLNAENLFTITGYSGFNPDVNSSGQSNINRGVDLGAYPLARVYRVGIRFGL